MEGQLEPIVTHGHLTSGKIEMDKGFEYYTFEVAMSGFEALANAKDPMEVLAGWYMLAGRPAAHEILGIHDTGLNLAERRVKITLKIMRGHYFLAHFVKEHGTHGMFGLECLEQCCTELYCDKCGAMIQIYKESIPNLRGLFVSAEQPDTQTGLPDAPERPS